MRADTPATERNSNSQATHRDSHAYVGGRRAIWRDRACLPLSKALPPVL